MTGLAEDRELLLEGEASDLAFHMGQVLERLLTERAVERAKKRCANDVAVTVEDMRASFDASLLEQLWEAMGVPTNGERADRQRLSA